MREQDQELEEVGATITTLKHMGQQINDELDTQDE